VGGDEGRFETDYSLFKQLRSFPSECDAGDVDE